MTVLVAGGYIALELRHIQPDFGGLDPDPVPVDGQGIPDDFTLQRRKCPPQSGARMSLV
jgi:hypothetical protein